MKQRILFLIASLLLMVASVQTALAQKQGSATERKAKMVVTTMDNQVVKFDVSNVKDVTFEEPEPIIDEDHEFVDLGLPSGTLWATCNVGANSPEEYGSTSLGARRHRRIPAVGRTTNTATVRKKH